MKLSRSDARKILLISQGLSKKHSFGKGRSGVYNTIKKLGYIQIDTLSVVQRSHHHTLWTRVKNYSPDILHTLQIGKKIFEYWSHAAAYLPMEHYRYSIPRMNEYRKGDLHWFPVDTKMIQHVLDRIKNEGSLRAQDFKTKPTQNSKSWWSWKPAKQALEQLFMEGRLIIKERVNFQKVYDLPERVLPESIDLTPPSKEELCEFLILQTINSFGLTTATEIHYLKSWLKDDVKKTLNKMLLSGQIINLTIEKIQKDMFYTIPNFFDKLEISINNKVHLLSPFDNAVIQREKLKTLFDFDYQIECYVPSQKRKFGYFCLPILYKDKFIGRMDVKAEKASQTFFVKNLVFENYQPSQILLKELCYELVALMQFNNCHTISIEQVLPNKFRVEMNSILKTIL